MPASTIIVSYRDGGVAKGKRVDMSIGGAFCKPAFTDSQGKAVIQHSSSGPAKVYLSGTKVGEFRAPGKCAVIVP